MLTPALNHADSWQPGIECHFLAILLQHRPAFIYYFYSLVFDIVGDRLSPTYIRCNILPQTKQCVTLL